MAAACLAVGVAVAAVVLTGEDQGEPVAAPATTGVATAAPVPGPGDLTMTPPRPTPTSAAPTTTAGPTPTGNPKTAVIPATVTATATIPGVPRLTPTPPSPPSSTSAATPVGAPVRLRIPSVDVDTDLLALGLTADGDLEAPPASSPDAAAWFDGSPRPGQPGPSVYSGDASGEASVLSRLGEVHPGARVLVDRADGTTATFAVDRVQRYRAGELRPAEVYGATTDPQVRVVARGVGGHTVVFGHLLR